MIIIGMPCNTIASCSEDRTVVIWRQTSPGEDWIGTPLEPFDQPVWRVSWSLTGNILAVSSGDNKVSIWKQALNKNWE